MSENIQPSSEENQIVEDLAKKEFSEKVLDFKDKELITNFIVAPKGRTGERKLTYESGMEPIGGAWIQFNIRYYMFALVFVIFDVETVFLYPWAVAFNLSLIHI